MKRILRIRILVLLVVVVVVVEKINVMIAFFVLCCTCTHNKKSEMIRLIVSCYGRLTWFAFGAHFLTK